MRATEGAVSKSKFINQTLDRVVGNFNARQELAGLKIGDIRPVEGEPAIKAAANSATALNPLQRHVFRDASGVPWDVTIPIANGNSLPVPVLGQGEKVKQKQLAKGWRPPYTGAAGALRPVVDAACDRSGRVVKAP